MATDIIARGLALSAVRVASSHIFANAGERDAYFATNPDELKEGMFIFVGDTIQQREGTEWRDAMAAIKGMTGDTGLQGADATINGYNTIEIVAGNGIELEQIDEILTISSTGGGEGGTYTNANPTPEAVGGIAKGTTFNNISHNDMWTKLLYKVINPTLTNPSFTFVRSTSGLIEVGVATSFDLTTTFNQGSINPAYTTNGKRSGLPNKYTYTGVQIAGEVDTNASTNKQQVKDLLFTVPGTQSWTSKVSYDAGQQPVNSEGNNYSTPYPAGTTTAKTISVEAVYPFYANSVNLTTMTKQSLTNGSYLIANFIPESATGKQSIEFASTLRCIGIQFYNDLTTRWEWIGGVQATSADLFEETTIVRTIGTENVNYTKLTNIDGITGARTLHFYVEEV